MIRYYSQMAEKKTDTMLMVLEKPSDFMTLKEKNDLGLMTGMAGIGYGLLRENNQMLPNLLALEV